MLNKKDLRAAIPKMREVAQLLTMWANDMESSLGKGGGRKMSAVDAAPTAEEMKQVAEVLAEVPVPADDPAAIDPPEELTYEKVREYLGKKSAAGYKTQVHALIMSFGVEKLSDVDPSHYPALIEAVSGLGGDGLAG